MSDDDLAALEAIAVRLDDVFELPLADAPGFCFVAAKFHVKDESHPARIWRFSAGAADGDRLRAFRRCIGEAAETMSQFRFAASVDAQPIFDAPEDLAPAEAALLAAIAGKGVASGWIRSERLGDGAPSSLPAALCFRDLAVATGTGLSLGCAAGHSRDSARLSALFETIERDAVALWWRGDAPALRFEDDDTIEAVDAMRGGASSRTTWFLDLTTDVGVPVVAAVSADGDGARITLGFAARATRALAARAALFELAQMELANRVVAMKAERAGIDSLEAAELRQFDRLRSLHADMECFHGFGAARAHQPVLGSTDVETLANVVSRLARQGISAHCVDLGRADLGIPVVKVVAPLLQAEPATIETERLARSRKTHAVDASSVSRCEIL